MSNSKEEVSFVYLLLSLDNKKFKIGKSDNVYNRYNTLRKNWGEFDLEKSWQIKCKKKQVHSVEKILHFIFDKWNIKLTEQLDGYTEWFDVACMDEVIDLLKHMIKHNDTIQLVEGIELPLKPIGNTRGEEKVSSLQQKKQASTINIENASKIVSWCKCVMRHIREVSSTINNDVLRIDFTFYDGTAKNILYIGLKEMIQTAETCFCTYFHQHDLMPQYWNNHYHEIPKNNIIYEKETIAGKRVSWQFVGNIIDCSTVGFSVEFLLLPLFWKANKSSTAGCMVVCQYLRTLCRLFEQGPPENIMKIIEMPVPHYWKAIDVWSLRIEHANLCLVRDV